MRIDVRRIETLKVGGEMIGNRTRAKVVKNKVAPPFREAEFDIMYGEGISKIGEIVDLGVKLELIDKAGAWFTVGGQRVQGRDAVKEYLRNNPEVCDKIEQEIRANSFKLMSPQARKAAQVSGRAVDITAVGLRRGLIRSWSSPRIRQTSSDRLIVTLDEAEEIKTTLGVVTEHRL